MVARNIAMMAGYPSGIGLSPSNDHIRVDVRAFPREQWVLVKLEVLGFDPGLWDGVAQISGQVLQRYYHEVHGQPMFSLDFGGTIGKREVLVLECVPDDCRQATGVTRVLDFGVEAVDCTPKSATTNAGGRCVTPGAKAGIDEDDLSDQEWVPTWEDFPTISSPGGALCSCGSFTEMPLRELGVYDEEEDTGSWDFPTVWADDQWQQTELTLLGNRDFTGTLHSQFCMYVHLKKSILFIYIVLSEV